MAWITKRQAIQLVSQQLDIVQYSDPIVVEVLNRDEIPERTLKIGTRRSPEQGFPSMPQIAGLVRTNNGDRDVFYTYEELKKILYIMFPYKMFKIEGKLWRKEIHLNQATRADLYHLEEQLPAKINLLGVNQIGISKMEAAINFLYLDELIRQETLSCPERGMLLQLIRREFQQFFDLYEELIYNATRLRHNPGNIIKEAKKGLQIILEEKTEIENELEFLDVELASVKRLAQTRVESLLKVYEDEMLCIKRSNQQMEMMLQICDPGNKALISIRSIFVELSRI